MTPFQNKNKNSGKKPKFLVKIAYSSTISNSNSRTKLAPLKSQHSACIAENKTKNRNFGTTHANRAWSSPVYFEKGSSPWR